MCGSLEDRKDAKNGKHGLARRQIHIENEREYNSEHQLPLVKSALLRRVAMATLSDKVPKVKYLLLGTVTVTLVSWWLSRSPTHTTTTSRFPIPFLSSYAHKFWNPMPTFILCLTCPCPILWAPSTLSFLFASIL